MIPTLHHYYLARLTLEAVTPLSITAGGCDGVFNVTLTRDANGLPTLPGTAIAGVLRHLFWHLYGESAMEKLFGSQQDNEGKPSQLQVSWGYIHDSHGLPVEGLLEKITDPLLISVVDGEGTTTLRDRVRINHRGSTSHQGKFDRSVLPAGHRFSTELALWSDQADDPRWKQILGLLQHPLFRLGGGTRAGLGRLTPISIHTGQFDLKTRAGRAAFLRLTEVKTLSKDVPKPSAPQRYNKSKSKDNIRVVEVTKTSKPLVTVTLPPDSIGSTTGLISGPLKAYGNLELQGFVTLTLNLTPHNFWRIGQGDTPSKPDINGKLADMLPKLETRIEWNDGEGKVGPAHLLVPASSLKGALAHRVAFHANRRAGRWATIHTPFNPPLTGGTIDTSRSYQENVDQVDGVEVRELFGFIGYKHPDTLTSPLSSERLKDKEHSSSPVKGRGQGGGVSQVGRVIFDDGFVAFDSNDLQLMMHNVIDRFTCGVREHMLFMEELVWNKPIVINGIIDTNNITAPARLALQAALNDLCQGRLSLGAGAGKGHGFFTGTVTWGDGGVWINSNTIAQAA